MSGVWKLLETISSEEEALLIAGFLGSEGIRCEIESLRFHQEPVNFGHLSEIRLRVQEDEIEEARRLLAGCRSSQADEESGDEGARRG